MTKKIQILFLFVILLFTQFKAKAQVEKYMAAFTYQICKSMEWPMDSSPFFIGVLGKTEITPFFMVMADEKKMGTKDIKVVEYKDINEIEDCHVLFVSEKEMKKFSQITAALKDQPILIVTESSESIKKGAGLSFKIIDNKIRFNLNKTDINNRKISVGSQIERMALKVY